MEEKHVWRVIFAVTLLTGFGYAQMDAATRQKVSDSLNVIVGQIDAKGSVSREDRMQIAESGLSMMENDVKNIPLEKCMNECMRLNG
jgi:hypothetical protein